MKTQAIISRNPGTRFDNDTEVVDTYDFTYSVQALRSLIIVAKQVKARSNPTDTELIMAECALQIGQALRLEERQ